MTNKQKYEGEKVLVYAPADYGGRYLGIMHVEEVLDDTKVCGIISGTDIYAVHDLNDGVHLVIVTE